MSFISRRSLFMNKSPSPSFKSENCSRKQSDTIKQSQNSRANSLTRRNIKLPECIVKSNLCPSALKNHSTRNSIPQDNNSPHKQRRHIMDTTSPNSIRTISASCSTPSNTLKQNNCNMSRKASDDRTSEEIKKFKDAFNSVDTDKDGRICPDELKQAFTKLGNIVTEDEIISMIKEVDTDPISRMSLSDRVLLIQFYYESGKSISETIQRFNSIDEFRRPEEVPSRSFIQILIERFCSTGSVADLPNYGNGTVEFSEFVVMMNHYYRFRHENHEGDSDDSEIYDAFKAFDHNGDGFIDSDEIKRTMLALGESVSDSDVMAMISEADADNDGRINYEEFKKIMAIFKRRAAQQ